MTLMLNPLALPQAVIDSLAFLPAIARDARRATDQMDQILERADRVIEQTDRLLERFDAAEDTIAELVEGGRRLEAMGATATAETAAMRKSFERAIPTAEELNAHVEPLLEAAAQAGEDLASAQSELARTNVKMARLIDLSGPLEKAGDRLERVVGRLRRDGTGSGPRPGPGPGPGPGV